MRPILYEMKKTATNWKQITVVAVLVLFTVLLFYSSINSNSSAGDYAYESSALFQKNGTYYLDNYVFNGFGSPLKNSAVQITLEKHGYAIESTLKSWNVNSNDAGYANITFPYSIAPAVSGLASYLLMVNVSSATSFQSSFLSFDGAKNNSLYPASGIAYSLQSVANSRNQYVNNILIQYFSFSGNRSQPLDVYYYYPSGVANFVNSQSINSSFVKAGTYSGFSTLIIKPNFSPDYTSVVVAITYGGSQHILSYIQMGYNAPTVSTFENVYFSGVAMLSIFMISIAGVVGGYVAFGKDRVTGVLDNVLARPIRRSNIIMSRYTASASIILGMSFLVGALDYLLVSYQYGIFLPLEFLILIGGGLAVTAIAFLGLTFLVSNLTRSSGNLIAASIILLIFYVFVWQIIQIIVPLHLTHGLTTLLTVRLEFIFNLLSPLNFSNLLYMMLSRPTQYAEFSPTFNQVGLNWYTLGIYGFLWIIIPIAVAFHMYRTRD